MKIEEVKVTQRTSYVDISGTCTGIYRLRKNKVVLIDSGRRESEEFFDWLEEQRLQVAAVIHTHLHIDHIANSNEVYRRYGARMIASPLEPLVNEYVKNGDYEFAFERNPVNGDIIVEGEFFKVKATPGHSKGHQLVITPDNVGFAGDAILTKRFLSKSKFPYMQDVKPSVESMKVIENSNVDYLVCSHNGVIEAGDIAETVRANVEKVDELFELLVETSRKLGPAEKGLLADRFMQAAGVYNPEIRRAGYMIETSQCRIDDLIDEGILRQEGQKIKWHPQPESNRQ